MSAEMVTDNITEKTIINMGEDIDSDSVSSDSDGENLSESAENDITGIEELN